MAFCRRPQSLDPSRHRNIPKLCTREISNEIVTPQAFITLADCGGLYYLFMQKRTAHGAAAIGLFWSATESLFHRLMPLWFEARSMQFSWNHTFTSIEANFGLVTHVCFALLVWMWLRRPQLRQNIAIAITVQRFVFPVIARFVFVHVRMCVRVHV
jgi:hypothetical protein